MKEKIIVFGATGSTGGYVVDYLVNLESLRDYEIVAVGRRKTNFFDRYNVKYVQVDITKEQEFNNLPQDNVKAVIFLAGILPAYMKGYNPKLYFEINTIGGFNVVEYCRRVNADRIIYAQTISDLAGYFGKELVLHPDMPRKLNYNNDHSVYVISKCAIVDLIENYHQMYGIKSFILRLPNIYMYNTNDVYYVDGIKKQIAYRYLINRAIKGEDIEVWGDSSKEKDIVYVKDLCQMIEKTILVNQDKGLYNVGTGIGTTLLEQIQGIVDVFSPENHKSKLIMCPEKPDNPSYIMDIDNAKQELGYIPKYDYISLLKDFKKEMEQNRFKELDKSFVK